MKTAVIASMCLLVSGMFAQEIHLKKIEDWAGSKSLVQTGEVISVKGKVTYLSSKQTLPFNPSGKYYISGELRKAAGQGNIKIFFGYWPITKDGREFDNSHVTAVKGTDTQLAETLVEGSDVIKVKDASKWKTAGTRVIYNTSPDYKDLPNFNQIRNQIKKIEKTGGIWTVTFAKPLNLDLPAGTNVRQHLPGGAMYAAACNEPLSSDWQKFEGLACGQLTTPGLSPGKFPIGTAMVRLLLFFYADDPAAVAEIRNVTFGED